MSGVGLRFPRQHGAWAMLAVPILLGVAAGGADPRQPLLGLVAVAAYLLSATAQDWLHARRRPGFGRSLAVYGAALALLGGPLLLAEPALLVAAALAVPGVALGLVGARPGARRELTDSLSQVEVALVLVPAAMLLAPPVEPAGLAAALGVALAYLVGTVLVVRSVIRERDNPAFARLALGWHAGVTLAAALLLPPVYPLLGLVLVLRAWWLPTLRRRRLGTARPLRPVHVGLIELVVAILVVVTAFVVPPAPGGPLG